MSGITQLLDKRYSAASAFAVSLQRLSTAEASERSSLGECLLPTLHFHKVPDHHSHPAPPPALLLQCTCTTGCSLWSTPT